MDEPRAKQEVEKQGQPDALVLYGRLVWEGVLPEGFDSSRSSTAQSPRQQNGKGRSSARFDNVAAAGWLSDVQATRRSFERGPASASLPSQKWLQRQQAEPRRLSGAVFNEPCTTHRRPVRRLKRPRGFVGFKLWRCWWRGRLRRWAISLHVSQAVLLCWAQAEEQLR